MSLRAWLLTLPALLMALIALLASLLILMSWRGSALLAATGERLAERGLVAEAASACDDITQRAIVWTMTRRVAERRQYEQGREECRTALANLVARSGAVETLDVGNAAATGASLTERFETLTKLLESVQAEHLDEAKMVTVGRLEREVKPLSQSIAAEFADRLARADATSQAALTALAAQQRYSAGFAAVAGVLGIMAAGLITAVVLRRLFSALRRAAAAARALAQGDLRHEIATRHHDELGSMLRALEEARRAWVSAIGRIQETVGRISLTSSEIGQGAFMLNDSAKSAADRLINTSGSMGELLAMVDASSGSARDANALAGNATQRAHAGASVVNSVVETMSEIAASSKRISEIIGTIDGIAFQTNILALNAAVEAARAGEAGRGFAVVASEVRALAQRSSTAAAEIRTLITSSVGKVQDGAQRADGAGSTIRDVQQVIDQVAGMMKSFADTSLHQGGEIQKLAGSIRDLGESTREHATMADLWAGSAGNLEQEAKRLHGLVEAFQLPAAQPAALASAAV